MISRAKFQKTIWDYYRASKRPFPWRETTDPYHILISEIMLQQTQTDRVVPYFNTWVKKFPTFKKLATASTADVLKAWQGLGYNRRALALKKLAEAVTKEYNGTLPDNFDRLVALPGIGPYTAGAILAFAFNKAVPFIETNIRRVYIHFFFHDHVGVSDKDIFKLVEATMDRDQPREWYSALMDYGVKLAKEGMPNPNRRSKHYTKQSKFEGSYRQVRGAILKILAQGPATISKIKKLHPEFADRLPKALADLQKEGFISIVRRRMQIL
jgi:A/G-specific adenine glycosylase